MKGLLRKIRGGFGMATVWALGWSATAFGLVYGASFFMPGSRGEAFWGTIWPIAGLTGSAGFVAGTLFSVSLSTFFKNRSLSGFRAGRMAILGAGSALLVPLVILGIGLAVGASPPIQLIVGATVALTVAGGRTGGGLIKIAQLASGSGPAVDSGDAPERLEP